MEKENDGMLEKMKRGIRLFSPFASEKEKQPVAAMNTPARLGRMESGYETLVRIFQSKLFLRNEEDRSRCYHFSLEITDSIIKNLNYIGKRKENFCGESCIPVPTWRARRLPRSLSSMRNGPTRSSTGSAKRSPESGKCRSGSHVWYSVPAFIGLLFLWRFA